MSDQTRLLLDKNVVGNYSPSRSKRDFGELGRAVEPFATPVLAQMDAIVVSDGLSSRRCRGYSRLGTIGPRRSAYVNGYRGK